ncbi:MAG: undecaprenyl-diphosphate phosphatase [Buchnera aphidicola (Schlechtendalia peitan)]
MSIYNFETYNILLIIFLGFIEGITEFFPISSTSHIIVFAKLLQIKQNEIKILNIFIQFGTSLSILIYFRYTFIKLFFSILKIKNQYTHNNNFSYYHICLSILPISFIGLYFNKYLETLLNFKNMCLSLVCGSILLTLAEIYKKKCIYTRKNINLLQSFTIGCFQCLALYPGFSRSCSTIAVSILLGINQHVASRFSFIISVPIFFGKTIFDIFINYKNIPLHSLPILLIGSLSAFLISSIFIKRFLKIISTCSFIPFIFYRYMLCLIIYIVLYRS